MGHYRHRSKDCTMRECFCLLLISVKTNVFLVIKSDWAASVFLLLVNGPLTRSLIHHTDRDPSKWGVDQKETLRRRELFWELYTYDSWQVSGNRCMCNIECWLILVTVLDIWTSANILSITYRLQVTLC